MVLYGLYGIELGEKFILVSTGEKKWTPALALAPNFDPTYTRTGWIGQPPILNRHEVVTIDGDVDTLGQATP